MSTTNKTSPNGNTDDNTEMTLELDKKLDRIIKACFIISSVCILCLTLIASYILVSNYHSQNSNGLMKNAHVCHNVDTATESSSICVVNLTGDSARSSVSNISKQKPSNNEINLSEPTNLLDRTVYNLTLAVNSVNNVLTAGSIFVAILTLFIGLVGLFGYHSLKTDLKDDLNKTIGRVNNTCTELATNLNTKYKSADDRITTIDTKIDDCCDKSKELIDDLKDKLNTKIDDCCDKSKQQIDNLKDKLNDTKLQVNENMQEKLSAFNDEINTKLLTFNDKIDNFNIQVDQIRNSLNQKDKYLDQTINYLFQATYSNINLMDDKDQAKQLLKNLFHDLQIAKLYQADINADEVTDINKIVAFSYLEENGIMADIPHLEYIAQHDPNNKIKDRAREIIGRIKQRNEKG